MDSWIASPSESGTQQQSSGVFRSEVNAINVVKIDQTVMMIDFLRKLIANNFGRDRRSQIWSRSFLVHLADSPLKEVQTEEDDTSYPIFILKLTEVMWGFVSFGFGGSFSELETRNRHGGSPKFWILNFVSGIIRLSDYSVPFSKNLNLFRKIQIPAAWSPVSSSSIEMSLLLPDSSLDTSNTTLLKHRQISAHG